MFLRCVMLIFRGPGWKADLVVDCLNILGAKSWHEGDWRELSCLLLELPVVLAQSMAPKQL